MNPTTHPTSRIHDAAEQVFGPVQAPRGSLQRRLLIARSAIAYFGVVTTLVQIVVWLTIGVFRNHLDSPWWLWTTVPAAAAVVCLTVADRWRAWWSATAARPTH